MTQPLRIGIIGDYDPAKPSHIATNDGLNHGAAALSMDLDVKWFPTDRLMAEPLDTYLKNVHGFWGSPGSPYNNLEGAIKAIQFAREGNWPFIGT